jgi:hypothetical protein
MAFPAAETVEVRWGAKVGARFFHAEAHHDGVLGGDFTYSATVTAEWMHRELCGDLQFRISDEGRYGVRLQHGKIMLYQLLLGRRRCNEKPADVAHCLLWPPSGDDPIETSLRVGNFNPAVEAVTVTIVAEGSHVEVRWSCSTGTGTLRFDHLELGIGRFGIYARTAGDARGTDEGSLFGPSLRVRFSEIAATTEPTAASNFALLYSLPGYDLAGTKRALVRTINDVDPQDFRGASSSFSIQNAKGELKIRGRRFEASAGAGEAFPWTRPRVVLRRTLGFQFLAADFSDLREPGFYVLEARLATSGGMRVLSSSQFEIAPSLITERMLWPLSILNAQARRAADDDFRRNWFVEAGREAWSVGLDGAFIADRADDQQGAVLRRIFDVANGPLAGCGAKSDFRFVARVTIVAGCDAQLQFGVTDTERWGVTLQAGDAGSCRHAGGSGAVRLHRENWTESGTAFEFFDTHRMDGVPFEAGRPYDVEIRADSFGIEVLLDGISVIVFAWPCLGFRRPLAGTFALKAWGSTARFEQVKVWARNVGLWHSQPGVWIPYSRMTGLSSQGFEITAADASVSDAPPAEAERTYPIAAQQHGFNDCNNSIGEVTSHSPFLSSLLEVWATRAHAASPSQQDDLRRAILTALLYLFELYEQGNRSGAFAHQEPGRAALDPKCDKKLTTQFAMYGLSAFADKGDAVDRTLADVAFDRADEAWRWLDCNGPRDFFIDSAVAIRMLRAAERQGKVTKPWIERVETNAVKVLAAFGQPGAMADSFRPTLRSIPWFEGLYEAFVRGPFKLTTDQGSQLAVISDQLSVLMDDPNNGFCLIPQAQDSRDPADPKLPAHNWNNLADLPLAFYPIPKPSDGSVGHWHITEHFATAAADCVYIGRLAGKDSLERLATANLYWVLGLNPGIPSTKVAREPAPGGPWSAASFVYNGPGAFARTIEGSRTRPNSAKGWLAEWEDASWSRHREMWNIDPLENGFQSIVNGHVLRENQWHYWSVGSAGWVSAETFMLIDATFLKAALALEDWHTGSLLVRCTPYGLDNVRFFDTTNLDRASTRWHFDDPDSTPPAMASRMVNDFAAAKGFRGGRLTGHHIGENIGVVCLPLPHTTFAEVPANDIDKTSFPFGDINDAPWAQVARAAAEIAAKRDSAAGFFTGHQSSESKGWIGLDATLTEIFDVDDITVAQSLWAFTEINTVGWAQAARVATDICIQRGFAGGFFTGHQLPNKRQVAALRYT